MSRHEMNERAGKLKNSKRYMAGVDPIRRGKTNQASNTCKSQPKIAMVG